ncbi:MAG: hypothetical protein Q4G67_09265 [Actinomycetia bacterium]|nr:hypothetical protein [Actinomycetes bacterium]
MRAPRRRPLEAELDEQTQLGEVYLRGLMRAQFRLAATVILIGIIGLGGLPLVLWLTPDASAIRFAGLPLVWILLGAVIYPVTVAVAAWYVRRATRLEAAFTDIVKRLS